MASINRIRFSSATLLLLVLAAGMPGMDGTNFASAQNLGGDALSDLFPDRSLGKYGQPASGLLLDEDPAEWKASYKTLDADAGTFLIEVQAAMNSPWHIYSTTQPKGGPSPTRLFVRSPDTVELSGPWKSNREPTRSVSEEFGGLTIEEFGDEVIFSAPARLKTSGNTVESIGEIRIGIDALACVSGGSCLPIDETIVAKFDGELSPEAAAAAQKSLTDQADDQDATALDIEKADKADEAIQEALIAELPTFREGDYSVQWKAWITDTTLLPGQQTRLNFTALPDRTDTEKYHVYPAVTSKAPKATNFSISEKGSLRIGKPTTDAVIVTEEPVPGLINVYHDGNVTWSMLVEVPIDAQPGQQTIRGSIAYQACTDQSCLMPMALAFEVPVAVIPRGAPEGQRAESPESLVPIALTVANPKDAMKSAADASWVDPDLSLDSSQAAASKQLANDGRVAAGSAIVGETSRGKSVEEAISFPLTLGFAFLGGVILNFMPCVLPVVGLKVMSFVQQAGEHRGRVLMLNLVYAAGILAVFALLAGLAVMFSFSWGEQFTYVEFRLGLTILMFALALSYLGVWEIPAPSFASSKASQELGAQEGYTGAFFKGVFATLMATPCSGPLLGYILGATINLSPVQTVVIMMTVGVGMAIPYLIIGARPSLVSWLPKPGPWMETLKEFLAFLFLGTVAFFFYGFSDESKVAVFVTLIGVWFGCWVIGKVPNWQTIQRRLTAWAVGVTAATAIGIWAFSTLVAVPGQEIIRWQPYSEAKLASLLSEGKTVVLDFTADWCVNCKVNEKFALNTEPTAEMLEKLDAVAMVADWSDRDNPEIKQKLSELQSRSIPVLAIYPGTNPNEPIILRDLVSQQSVLNALKEAGPSRPGSPRVAAVEN